MLHPPLLALSLVLALPSCALASPSAFPFSPGFDIARVAALAASLPTHSWEFGTAAEALLELYDAPSAIFARAPFPVPTLSPSTTRALAYAQSKIVLGAPPNGLADGDGATGDPASLGVSAVLLGQTNATYAAAAAAEAEYLLARAPRWANGAISHRAAYAELWADFVYMAPPFLAYYGVSTGNASVLRAAVEQCLLYAQVLRANTTTTAAAAAPPATHPASAAGLWVHIVGPANADPGLWATGNAWAAAGALRVLATLLKAPAALFSASASGPHASTTGPAPAGLPWHAHTPTDAHWRHAATHALTSLITSLLSGALRQPPDPSSGLLRNYLDDATWFGDTSSSALLASVAFRLATLSASASPPLLAPRTATAYLTWATRILTTLGAGAHVRADGVVGPAVDPLDWGDRAPWTTGSPEGQNFVVLLYAAWRDCVRARVPGCAVV